DHSRRGSLRGHGRPVSHVRAARQARRLTARHASRAMSLGREDRLLCQTTRSAERLLLMTKVLAGITTSIDGYITGPDDGPGKGLGEGGERLHYWVFGGPWTYGAQPKGEPA